MVADGRVFVGTNNKAGWLPRYPGKVDLGCLLAFDVSDGSFLWQHSSEKLKTGRVHDWPDQGICCAPLVEGNRLWFVTSRGEVRCLDTEGFYDGEDDGEQASWSRMFLLMKKDNPELDKVAAAVSALKEGKLNDTLRTSFEKAGAPLPEQVTVSAADSGKKWNFIARVGEADRKFEVRQAGPKLLGYKMVTPDDKNEADVIWVFDMMKKLKISQHNMCSCSVTAAGDTLFVNTSNGVDEQHISLPAPNAPSFFAMDKNTGEVLWTDASPGLNILHGQWSSPTYGVLDGVPQVLFGGGDGWLYSFDPAGDGKGNSKLLWKFDCNPKDSLWELRGRGTRNNLIGTPVIYDGLVYMAVGQDPEHGDGPGHLWCIDPTRRGDVSPTLAFNVDDPNNPLPPKRLQTVDPEKGEVARDNSNSAVVWHYDGQDLNGDGKIENVVDDYTEMMHRSCGTVAIKDDILYIADFSGFVHCADAKTGKVFWTHDMLASAWGSPLIVEGKVYIGDEDGDMTI
ncbi:MAG: PQQ-binding-like beta-propeller repeat protein, partial [Planctomycetales bacterium]